MSRKSTTAFAAIIAAGFLSTASAGYADTVTSGNGSVLSGNQLDADVNLPINVCGNAVAIAGVAAAQCEDSGAVVVDDSDDDTVTSGNGSVGSGNQVDADVDAPVNVCGNAVSVVGTSAADCEDSGAAVIDEPESPDHPEPEYPDHPEPENPDDYEPENPGHPHEPEDDGGSADTPPPEADGGAPGPGPEGDQSAGGDDLPTTGPGLITLISMAAAALAAGAGVLLLSRRRGSAAGR